MKNKYITLLLVFWHCQVTFSQNVGIGTSTPGSKLEIKSNNGAADLELNAAPNGDNALLKLNKKDDNAFAGIRFKNAGIPFWDLGTINDNNFKLKYTPTNNTIFDVDNATQHLGIFTNDFSEDVNIGGNVSAYGSFISRFSNAGFQFKDRTLSTYGGWNWYADNGKANLYRYTSGGDLLTISEEGNLGIGQTAPIAPLSFSNTVGSKIDLFHTSLNSRYGLGVQGGLLQIYTNTSGADIALGYGSSESFTENARFAGTGGLQVQGSTAGFWFRDRSLSSDPGWNLYADNGYAHLFGYNLGSDVLTIDNVGNLGIGTTGSPGAKLEVNGQLKISGGDPAQGKVFTSDAVGLGSWTDQPLSNQERFRFFYDGSQIAPSGGSNDDFNLQGVEYNYSAFIVFDAGANTITFNKGGLYHIEVNGYVSNATSTNCFVFLGINGAVKPLYYQPLTPVLTGFNAAINTSVDIVLSAGTVLKLLLKNGPVLHDGYITGHLISE